jgi:hydroxyethylthiazole kinase-like uncharacterized protein yjeF
MKVFNKEVLKDLYIPRIDSSGEQNGQVAVIGGSKLFHGAPIFALKVASKIVDMVFLATPEPGVGKVAERLKSKLLSFIWVPWNDVDKYVEKSDAALIGPGFMRFGSESTPEGNRGYEDNNEGKKTREITKSLLMEFPDKKWVIDAGSLQVMDTAWIPENSILTPNGKEFKILFGKEIGGDKNLCSMSSGEKGKLVGEIAKSHKCVVVLKGSETVVGSLNGVEVVRGGNAGMTKGGTGDVLAGLTVALLAKNEPFLAATTASYIVKAAGDELFEKMGVNYNSDDLVDQIPITLKKLLK